MNILLLNDETIAFVNSKYSHTLQNDWSWILLQVKYLMTIDK